MATTVTLPRLTTATEEVEVINWLKNLGDPLEEGEPLVEVMSDKAIVEIPSPTAGVLLEIFAQVNETVSVGDALALIGEPGESLGIEDLPQPHQEPIRPKLAIPDLDKPNLSRKETAVRASPVARRLAKKTKIDLDVIQGTGPRGIITLSDVQATIDKQAIGSPTNASLSGFDRDTPRVERLTGIQKVMADRIGQSNRFQVPVTTAAEVDMSTVVQARTQIQASYTAFVVKAAALALKNFPILNACLFDNEIRYFDRIDINVSLETKQGLLVPIIREADKKGLRTIHKEIQDLANRGRQGTLNPDEMELGTFTVTNSGVLGSLFYTPVINYPQSAILGMGKVLDTPVVRDGQVAIRPMMIACLSYDHRLIAGSPAVRFLQDVKSNLESILAFLLDANGNESIV